MIGPELVCGNVPDEIRLKPKFKYPEKILAWLAITERGVSKTVFLINKASLTCEIYKEKCITKYLVPFIIEYHHDGEHVFWPDLATAHHIHANMNRMKDLEIPFVPTDKYPSNCPQLRPIKNVWAILKEKVYEGGWEVSLFQDTEAEDHQNLHSIGPYSLPETV